jgi:glycogen debranching enzyme
MSTASSQELAGGPLVIDGISYIPSSVLLTGIPKLTFKDNRAFGVLDPRGEAPRAYSDASELGLYFNDTRYLSTWEMTFNNAAPVALSHELRFGGNTLVISMTNRDMKGLESEGRIPRDTFLIRRILTLVDDTLYEIVAIRNFDAVNHTLQVEQWAGTRFHDIFEVRGFERQKRGKMLAPEDETAPGPEGRRITTLRYEGLDNLIRSVHIQRHFEAEKIRVSPMLAGYFTRVTVPAKGDAFLKTVVSFDERHPGTMGSQHFVEIPVPKALEVASARAQKSRLLSGLQIECDNEILNRALRNSAMDIQMLLTDEPGDTEYPYAGIPWFSAPFGRDGIITAYQMLPWYPALANGVLNYAFQTLGTRVDDFTDEQPGKVFHEMRRGEMSNTREVPFIPYYGSVDSTPLCLILLHEYISWTLDLESLKRWWPEALRALAWIEKWGDTDQDGFLEYQKQSPTGLVNQGWKDSHDSVMHADGALAVPPIRLCEVQAYAFRARMGMSTLARLLGNSELSARLRIEALRLRARFLASFWDAERAFVYLALDGSRQPCKVLSSNMGHCLWSEILGPEEADHVARHLLSSSMFNGFGIRTLADTEKAYNPLSYHNGSVWPHDNSLIMEGLRNYGKTEELERLAMALMCVLESSHDFRLPELFCGFRRRGSEPPVPYEVACKPQAWAAGSVFLMLKSMLGLSMDPEQSHVVFRSPVLTPRVGELSVRGLRGRDWEIDVVLRRSPHGTTVDITRRTGHVRVLTVR